MTTLLQIHTSIHAERGQSSRLAQQFVDTWQASHPGARVLQRDLVGEAVPHLTGERFAAFGLPRAALSDVQRAVVDYSDALIAELRGAEVVVLGLPMYNFGVPSQLKAYFDHIARAGVSFRYGAQGPQGLLGGRKVYVFAARGGLYAGTTLDTQSQYVRDFLRFIGIEDIEFVYAEGLALGEDRRAAGIAGAVAQIQQLAA